MVNDFSLVVLVFAIALCEEFVHFYSCRRADSFQCASRVAMQQSFPVPFVYRERWISIIVGGAQCLPASAAAPYALQLCENRLHVHRRGSRAGIVPSAVIRSNSPAGMRAGPLPLRKFATSHRP